MVAQTAVSDDAAGPGRAEPGMIGTSAAQARAAPPPSAPMRAQDAHRTHTGRAQEAGRESSREPTRTPSHPAPPARRSLDRHPRAVAGRLRRAGRPRRRGRRAAQDRAAQGRPTRPVRARGSVLPGRGRALLPGHHVHRGRPASLSARLLTSTDANRRRPARAGVGHSAGQAGSCPAANHRFSRRALRAAVSRPVDRRRRRMRWDRRWPIHPLHPGQSQVR